ncbi:MAG: futalosine hydrolase [Thermodesulfobacteriota bacterium]
MTNKILVIAAVYSETEFILENMENTKSDNSNYLDIKKGKIGTKDTDVIVTGPGILNSVCFLTRYLENNTHPDFIIQTGCAGGFAQRNILKGDIGIASEEIYIHLGTENPENRFIPSPLPFSLSDKGKIKNIFKTDENLARSAFNIINSKTDLKAEIYPFITVSEITSTKEKADNLFFGYNPGMENMEGAGSAYVSFLYDIPFIEIRSASNQAGTRDKKKWDFNLSFANSGKAVLEFIKNI